MRHANARPTVAAEFRLASLATGACFLIIMVAQFAHVVAQDNDYAVLDVALQRDEIAHSLNDVTSEFRLAAIDLVNDANAGHDAGLRQRQLRSAARGIRAHYARLSVLGDDQQAVPSVEIDRTLTFILEEVASVTEQTPVDERERTEDLVEEFSASLEAVVEATETAAVTERRERSEALRDNDIRAAVLAISVIAAAFALGFYFYRRLDQGVFPAANFMRLAIVRMANGHLDIDLPDQHFTEPQQMTIALRKLRATARREQQYAMFDFMTSLPNRRALAGALANWSEGEQGSLVIVDVDGFKQVNDNFGHPVGDELVRKIAVRLRDVAPDIAIVARLGGDEFAILLAHGAEYDVETLGRVITEACAKPLDALGNTLSVTVSVGITALACEISGALTLSEALKTADLALYAAKSNGRNGYAVYAPHMQIASDLVQLLENDLDAAIAKKELHLAFQPIIAASGGELEVEALLRWTHPTLGAVSPEQVIAIAERSGQMERLGHWITGSALDALVEWPGLSVSLNLSPRQLRAANFVETLTSQCRKRGIVSHRVMLEITESVAMDDLDTALLKLQLLQSLGFRIALDDFGKGYSSMWMLKQFAFDRIKIDRSLVEDIEHSPAAEAILAAAVGIGRQLDMQVVAEGVDGHDLATKLTEIGCTHLQGYLFSRPLEHAAVASFYSPAKPQLRLVG
ncbi:MAG: EAL domain-containing protein [Sphingopyxis sp.]|nr:EAL domain-containing protein [Sphingopyxis sp.]